MKEIAHEVAVKIVMDALISEFQATRAEIVETIKIQYTILYLGTVIMTGLFALAIAQIPSSLGISLLLLIPFLAIAVAALWGVEGIRRIRAASYIRSQTQPKINAIYEKSLRSVSVNDQRLFNFESWFREERIISQFNNFFYRLSEIGVIVILQGGASVALALAAYHLYLIPSELSPASILLSSVVLVAEIAGILYVTYVILKVIEKGRYLFVSETVNNGSKRRNA